jgi:ATP-dependent DNA helicase RecQ
MDKYGVLKHYFGYDTFKPGQSELIDSILSGRDALGVMPTGSGKSLCYQIPAMLLPGISLILSPLISLMKDQVGALVQSGVPAAYLNSSLSATQQAAVLRRALNGAYKILYVAPERLNSEDFLGFALNTGLSMLTVDEAHCISHWGHDFRPSYLKITEFISRLQYRPVISAFTATATAKVRSDIAHALTFKDPFVLVTGFDRKNLYFEVRKPASKAAELIKYIRSHDGSGIVYCATRKSVEQVTRELQDHGFSATRYHAGLTDSERRENQDDFLYDKKTIMVATNAFGMGIDKSNVSYVLHYHMPKNIESYYQEAGRSGRDGERAECVILYSPKDVLLNRFLIENSQETNEALTAEERETIKENELDLLKQMTFYCTTGDCLRSFILEYFGEQAPVYCGHCGSCDTVFESTDVTVEAQKIISCVIRINRMNRSFGRSMIADILHGSKNARIIDSGMDKLPTYATMSDDSLHRIRIIMDYMIENQYLRISGSEYPVVIPGRRAIEIVKQNTPVFMKLPMAKKAAKPKPVKASRHPDEELFNKLKALRTHLALKAGVPPYVVFSNAVLSEMCLKLPCTKDELLNVSGIGPIKCERYGDSFMRLIKDHIESVSEN